MSAWTTATGANAVGTDDASNPYLAHLYPGAKQTGKPVNGNDPLHGLIPRKVTATQAVAIMVCVYLRPLGKGQRKLTIMVTKDGEINPWTKRPLSADYKKILVGRKKLPVFAQIQDFYDLASFPHSKRVLEPVLTS